MTRPFGEDGGMFKHSLLLVLANRLVTCAISWSSALYYGEHVAPAAPITSYMAVSLANVVATTCQVRGKGCTWRKGGGGPSTLSAHLDAVGSALLFQALALSPMHYLMGRGCQRWVTATREQAILISPYRFLQSGIPLTSLDAMYCFGRLGLIAGRNWLAACFSRCAIPPACARHRSGPLPRRPVTAFTRRMALANIYARSTCPPAPLVRCG